MKKTIRIKDVALAANVSSATVSRVISNKGPVRPATKKRVLEAIEALRYKPSRVARSLRVSSSQIIGLIVSDIQNPFFTTLARAVEDSAQQKGFAIFLCNSDESYEKESFYIDLMISEKVAGVILTPTQEHDCQCQKLLEVNIPVVSVDRRVLNCDIDTVVVDNIAGSFEAVSYLIQMGHTRIGTILGQRELTTGRERYEGYSMALSQNGLFENPEWVKFAKPSIQSGLDMGRLLLSTTYRPTAVFTGNSLIAIGFMQAVKEANLSIPKDISLISFDDPVWATFIQPQLTVVAQPTYELGRIAAEILIKQINEVDSFRQTIVLPTKLIIRESVSRIERSESKVCKDKISE